MHRLTTCCLDGFALTCRDPEGAARRTWTPPRPSMASEIHFFSVSNASKRLKRTQKLSKTVPISFRNLLRLGKALSEPALVLCIKARLCSLSKCVVSRLEVMKDGLVALQPTMNPAYVRTYTHNTYIDTYVRTYIHRDIHTHRGRETARALCRPQRLKTAFTNRTRFFRKSPAGHRFAGQIEQRGLSAFISPFL